MHTLNRDKNLSSLIQIQETAKEAKYTSKNAAQTQKQAPARSSSPTQRPNRDKNLLIYNLWRQTETPKQAQQVIRKATQPQERIPAIPYSVTENSKRDKNLSTHNLRRQKTVETKHTESIQRRNPPTHMAQHCMGYTETPTRGHFESSPGTVDITEAASSSTTITTATTATTSAPANRVSTPRQLCSGRPGPSPTATPVAPIRISNTQKPNPVPKIAETMKRKEEEPKTVRTTEQATIVFKNTYIGRGKMEESRHANPNNNILLKQSSDRKHLPRTAPTHKYKIESPLHSLKHSHTLLLQLSLPYSHITLTSTPLPPLNSDRQTHLAVDTYEHRGLIARHHSSSKHHKVAVRQQCSARIVREQSRNKEREPRRAVHRQYEYHIRRHLQTRGAAPNNREPAKTCEQNESVPSECSGSVLCKCSRRSELRRREHLQPGDRPYNHRSKKCGLETRPQRHSQRPENPRTPAPPGSHNFQNFQTSRTPNYRTRAYFVSKVHCILYTMNGELDPEIDYLACCKMNLEKTLANPRLYAQNTYYGRKVKHTNTPTKYSHKKLCVRMSTQECYEMSAHAKKYFRDHVCQINTRLVKTITKQNKLKTYQYHVLNSLSKGTHRSAPQIKLWGGVALTRPRENHTPLQSTKNMIRLICTHLLHHSNTLYKKHTQSTNENTWLEGYRKMLHKHYSKNLSHIHIQGLKNKNIRHIQIHIQCFLSSFSSSMQCMSPQKTYVKSKNQTPINAKDKVLTHINCYNSMSPKTSSYSSAQRYKDVMLAIEGNTEKDLSVTQKRSSNIDGTSSQKKAKGKSKTIL